MTPAETIFALSTGAGRAAIAVIRVSGPGSAMALSTLAGGLPAPRRLVRRRLTDPDGGEPVDVAAVVWLPGPGTATGEDMAEFHVHGSDAVVAQIFGILARLPGLRLAAAGEFTRRGFANGKIDLVEAEGLGDLLEARTESQRKLALHQFMGGASAIVENWRRGLIDALAAVDAVVEFVDEGDVAGVGDDAWRGLARTVRSDMERAVALAGKARNVRQGLRVVLAGAPNTGKSSLLNAVAQRDVAIVSPVAGTTRDSLEVHVELAGVPVVLADTAGLRADAGDEIEKIGMARSRRSAAEADVLVWVWSRDVSGSATVSDGLAPDLVVENKSDLAVDAGSDGAAVRVSSQTGAGLTELLLLFAAAVSARACLAEPAVVVRERQEEAVRDSIRHLNDALALPPGRMELVSAELRAAANALARLTGRIDVENWLDAIFSRFCIGK
jgi:tRNA modification GTPase